MTREEIKQICRIYDGLRAERDAATIAYNSEDTFWEHVLVTYNLSQPPTPSNLDEAAEEYGRNTFINECMENGVCDDHDLSDAFKAGAEWMAGQFQKIDGSLVDWYETNGVEYCHGISTNESFEVPEGFYIRKK